MKEEWVWERGEVGSKLRGVEGEETAIRIDYMREKEVHNRYFLNKTKNKRVSCWHICAERQSSPSLWLRQVVNGADGGERSVSHCSLQLLCSVWFQHWGREA